MSKKNNHRRYNPLLDEWVIVAENRVSRPWQGAKTDPPSFSATTGVNSLAPGGKRFNDVVTKVVKVWIEQFQELKQRYIWIQIFENRGAAVGCSNAHPHGQLWAGNFLPNLPSRKDKCQREYYARRGLPLLFDYLQKERAANSERIVLQNQHWTDEQISLADILRRLIIKYDNIFKCPFPFSMGWLGAPTGPALKEETKHWYLHASFHPPLLRSVELAGSFRKLTIRDSIPVSCRDHSNKD
ncbi:UTP--hexose-1-phosphate uridylyltransferase [Ancylostoma ceylanicum]|uniref:Galactose-1-phosphate uridylyltransferase n=1 Tax=Ancylostoma ceylanicum TaxID=53326 RepID=A0A0D6LLI1_9BILA|nr:UTP--hexose-1-phosphate uridylyltransferase [Ancylostoma ceylanicum]